MFESEVFRKQMLAYYNKESTCSIVRAFHPFPQLFVAPIVIRRPGNRAPLAHLVTSLIKPQRNTPCKHTIAGGDA